MTNATATSAKPLTDAQTKHFAERGYLVLDGFIPQPLNDLLKREIDTWLAAAKGDDDRYATPTGEAPKRPLQIELPEHGKLVSHPPLMDIMEQLMGPGFGYHHLHTARHDAGCDGVNWHHDYEQYPQANRSHLMTHVFYYLNGLDGTVGDLLALPGTQNLVMERNAYSVCGTGTLPGEMVFDNLSPGSAVIVHSALLHARRAKPGGEGKARYFIDCSYCQAGTAWPASWNYKQQFARARELGLDRGGRYAHLFDEATFFDPQKGMEKLRAINKGSLVQRL